MTFQLCDQIANEFSIENPQDPVVTRLLSLASKVSLSGKQLAEKWQLYAIQRKLCVIGNGGPSLEDLDGFQESLVNPAAMTPKKARNFVSTPSRNNRRPPGSGQVFDLTRIEQELDISAKSLPATPRPNRTEFKVEKWEKSGEIVSTLHASLPLSTQEPEQLADFNIMAHYEESSRYMSLNFTEAANMLDSWIEERSFPLLQEFQNLKAEESGVMDDDDKTHEVQLQIPSLSHQAPFVTVGRICCSVDDNSDNHLTGGVTLEPAQSIGSTAARIPLDLSALPSFSVFPGQIVGVEGTNPTGTEMRVSKLLQGSLPPPGPNVVLGATKIAVACGPFTKETNLKFEPLTALLESIDPPHLLVLVGPFLSEDHPIIQSGKCPSHSLTFSTFVAAQLTRFKSRCPNTQVALVPSARDVFHPFVTLPQPGFTPSPDFGLPPGLFHLPGNPGRFTINNIEILCPSYDIILALAGCEISKSDSRPRLVRLADHLLHSAHLFPLYPPPEDFCSDVNLSHLNSFSLTHLPQILITPSNLLKFSSIIGDGSVVGVNPGRLTVGERGGSYALINVFVEQLEPQKESGLWNPSQCRVDIINV